jgi:hypothetical protein
VIRLALILTLLLAPAAQASRLVTYTRTGGIAGEHTELRINRDRVALLDDRRGHSEGRLGKKRYRALRNALRAAKFETLESSYEPQAVVSDGITETARFHGRTVSVSTGGDPPKRLERALAKLRALTTQ